MTCPPPRADQVASPHNDSGFMKISHKLIGSFWLLTLCIWASTYSSVVTSHSTVKQTIINQDIVLAHEMLIKIHERLISRAEIFQEYTRDVLLQNGITQANSDFAILKDDIQQTIDGREAQWNTSDDLYQQLSANGMSEELREKQDYYTEKYGYPLFTEILITNRYGAIAALTNKSSDYRQDDEEWWQKAKETGLFLGTIGFDDSSEIYAIPIGIRIDDQDGNFQGALKVVLNLRETIEITSRFMGHQGHSPQGYYLLTRDQKIIYSASHTPAFLTDVSQQEPFQQIQGHDGSFLAPDLDTPSETEELFYVFAQSLDPPVEQCLGWALLIAHDPDEIFATCEILKHRLRLIALAATIFALFISILVFRLISSPLTKLQLAIEEINRGKTGGQVKIQSNDEIGALGRTFNEMSTQLKKTTVSRDTLQEEIRQHLITQENLQKAMAEVKSLSGLLPICSHCKKIRDDSGYWNQMESYISQHSGAQFSHGICEECLQKHYPEYADDIKKS